MQHASKALLNVAAIHSGKAKDAYGNTGTLAERRKYAKEKHQQQLEQQELLESPVDPKSE